MVFRQRGRFLSCDGFDIFLLILFFLFLFLFLFPSSLGIGYKVLLFISRRVRVRYVDRIEIGGVDVRFAQLAPEGELAPEGDVVVLFN